MRRPGIPLSRSGGIKMKKSYGWTRIISRPAAFSLMFTFMALAGFARSARAEAAQPPRRLIQTGPQQRAWMDEAQIDAISRVQHEAGKCGGYMDVTDTVARGADELIARSSLIPAALV